MTQPTADRTRLPEPEQIPPAPARPPGRLPKLRVEQPKELWRLHWESDPNRPPRRGPRWRFDPPAGDRPVTYTNLERHHIFIEIYGDTTDRRVITPDQAERRISCATVARPLALVDLGDAQTLQRLHTDLRLTSSIDYESTRDWGQRIYEWLTEADGIRYPGRKAGRSDNVVLFLDRCEDALDWEQLGTIATERTLVMAACRMFDIVPLVYLAPAPAKRWP